MRLILISIKLSHMTVCRVWMPPAIRPESIQNFVILLISFSWKSSYHQDICPNFR